MLRTRLALLLPQLRVTTTTATMATTRSANGGGPAKGAAGGAPPAPAAGGAGTSARASIATETAPLSAVVKDAVRRWYEDALREAERGDIKQQALLSQMLIEGYGCTPDPVAAERWAARARRKGYRMEGVYCTI